MRHISPEEHLRPSTPEIQAEVEAICEYWGITPPNLLEKISIHSPFYEDLSTIAALISGFDDPWCDAPSESTAAEPDTKETMLNHKTTFPRTHNMGHTLPYLRSPGLTYSSASDISNSPFEVKEAWEPVLVDSFEDSSYGVLPHKYSSPIPFSPSPSAHPATLLTGHPVDRPTYSHSIAPSKRDYSVHDAILPQPYPQPSSRYYHRHFPGIGNSYVSLSSPERRHKASGRQDLGVRPTQASWPKARVEYGKEQISHDLLLDPKPSVLRVRKGRIPVPLGEWRPKRAPKMEGESMGSIEFWTQEIYTGNKTLGTCLADRFQDDTGRSLISENKMPFPEKKEKGFNLRLLWPGYSDFSKKISVHKPLSECTFRDVRDWVFNAISDFIRTPGVRQVEGGDTDYWRVGVEDESTIHLDDLVLVRLRQVAKGTWIPELDLLDWERIV